MSSLCQNITKLSCNVIKGCEDMVEALVNAGADINARYQLFCYQNIWNDCLNACFATIFIFVNLLLLEIVLLYVYLCKHSLARCLCCCCVFAVVIRTHIVICMFKLLLLQIQEHIQVSARQCWELLLQGQGRIQSSGRYCWSYNCKDNDVVSPLHLNVGALIVQTRTSSVLFTSMFQL